MSATAIYLIPDTNSQQHPLQSLAERLLSQHNPAPLPPWFLEHRLYRSVQTAPPTTTTTPSANEPAADFRYHHVLALSYHPRKAYAYIPGANVVTLPTAQANTLNGLLSTKMALLWTPRASLTAANGLAYEIQPGLTVRLAELRQLGQQGQHRGTVVCIQSAPPSSAETAAVLSPGKIKSESGEGNEQLTRVREVWASLGVPNVKEFVADSRAESSNDGSEEIKAWCEALRLRG